MGQHLRQSFEAQRCPENVDLTTEVVDKLCHRAIISQISAVAARARGRATSERYTSQNMHISHTHGGFHKWGTPVIIYFRLGFSLINHPFWEAPICGKPHM